MTVSVGHFRRPILTQEKTCKSLSLAQHANISLTLTWFFHCSLLYESGSSSNVSKSSFRSFFSPISGHMFDTRNFFAKPRLFLSSHLMALSWFQLLFSTLENKTAPSWVPPSSCDGSLKMGSSRQALTTRWVLDDEKSFNLWPDITGAFH